MLGIIFGLIFIALGLVTLLKSAGIIIIDLDFGLIFWSLLFLFIGLKLIIKPKKHYHFWNWSNSSQDGCNRSDNQKF